jgi:catechol 2,3-dioxygenase-like lactoylglutathione lyase family enzyme
VPGLRALDIADPPEVWSELGFAVAGSSAWIGGVEHRLAGSEDGGRGLTGWTLSGLEPPEVGLLDGLPTAVLADGVSMARAEPHPNGTVAIDHVVVATPDIARTVARFEEAGMALRGTRDSDTYGMPLRQAFFKLGPVIVELIGPPEPAEATAGRPAGFFGLAFTVADLDATAAWLGPRLHPAKDAVQPGRRIATLDRAAGSTVAIAFMSR